MKQSNESIKFGNCVNFCRFATQTYQLNQTNLDTQLIFQNLKPKLRRRSTLSAPFQFTNQDNEVNQVNLNLADMFRDKISLQKNSQKKTPIISQISIPQLDQIIKKKKIQDVKKFSTDDLQILTFQKNQQKQHQYINSDDDINQYVKKEPNKLDESFQNHQFVKENQVNFPIFPKKNEQQQTYSNLQEPTSILDSKLEYKIQVKNLQSKLEKNENLQHKLFNKYIDNSVIDYKSRLSHMDNGRSKNPPSLIYQTLKQQIDDKLRNPVKMNTDQQQPSKIQLVDLSEVKQKKSNNSIGIVTENPLFHKDFYYLGNPKEIQKSVTTKASSQEKDNKIHLSKYLKKRSLKKSPKVNKIQLKHLQQVYNKESQKIKSEMNQVKDKIKYLQLTQNTPKKNNLKEINNNYMKIKNMVHELIANQFFNGINELFFEIKFTNKLLINF